MHTERSSTEVADLEPVILCTCFALLRCAHVATIDYLMAMEIGPVRRHAPRGPDVGLWYECYGSSLHGVAARITRDRDDADDVLQDAFLAAWRSRERFDATRDPLPWLATIARRKALTLVAARGRRATEPQLSHTAPSAEDEAIHRESDARVRHFVRNDLAFALQAIADLPVRAVAEQLGVPMRTAASRIARARHRFRASLPAITLTDSRPKAPWSISS
jgi:RNA polymerase sigma factor (sigma-70 family)